MLMDYQQGKLRWLVANTTSGAMAIDLPMADYLLFYESPTSPIIRAQAEARPMSRGGKVLLIDDMICSPSERRVLGFIREGKTALSSLLSFREELGLLRKAKRV
jgi:ERCC4-related helicase